MFERDIFRQNWYNTVRDYTIQLVQMRGVSPDRSEISVAQAILHMLADGLKDTYTAIGLEPVRDDPYERVNVCAFLRGQSTKTLVLLGHFDTVDTQDYGPLEPYALNPEELAARLDVLLERVPELQEDLNAYPGDWLFGRGSADMKSGVAANIAVMRHLAERARTDSLPLSIVFLATPDEENESAGVLATVDLLHTLRQQHGLDYLGAINTDYTTSRYQGDPHRYVYTGTSGKLLPSFLIIGRESHVGEPFDGIDANLLAAELIRRCSMNDDLCDAVGEYASPPPVTLKASDLKAHYDVQIPFAAYFYINVLTLTTTPDALLARLRSIAEEAVKDVLTHIDEIEQRWRRRNSSGRQQEPIQGQPRSESILTYEELYNETLQRLGKERVQAELADEWGRWPAELDKRERSLHLVHRLWRISGRQGPAVILYYSPPYYPHIAATPCILHTAISEVVKVHADLHLVQQEYYPYISDMSYLRLDPGTDLHALKANIPVWQEWQEWQESDAPRRPGSYTLPLERIQQLNLPVANFGPYGRGAHQHGERVLMSYSFDILPQLIYETVEQVAMLIEDET